MASIPQFSRRLFLSLVAIVTILGILHISVFYLAEFRPVHDLGPAFGIIALFWVVFALSSSAIIACYRGSFSNSDITILMDRIVDRGGLKILLLFSVIGCALHAYAKYSVAGVDALSCFFEIRFLWASASRESMSLPIRVFSMAGHVLTAMALPAIIISGWKIILQEDSVKKCVKFCAVFVLANLVGFIYSSFLGSRNAMILFLIVSIFGLLLGFCKVGVERKALTLLVMMAVVPLAISAAFSSLVFLDRMTCKNSNSTQTQYLQGFEDEIPLIVTKSDAGSLRSNVLTNCRVCNGTFLYLSHGIMNLAKVAAIDERGKPVLASSVSWIFSRLGLSVGPDGNFSKRAYGKGGLPLAGGAYHDYGLAGTIAVAGLLGVIVGMAVLGISGAAGMKGTIVALVVLTCFFYVLSLSYIFVATGLMFFPFLMFACLVGFGAMPYLPRKPHVRM